ncbi:MAG: hypothetical protein GW778_06045 [Alphaproteobacteria bacterium]|nr:hypothetical protein [Alphaproteobacteria bacterium]
MPELDIEKLLYFSAFILPGAISLLVHKLIESSKEDNLKEKIIEAIVYSMANITIVILPLKYAFESFQSNEFLLAYGVIVFCFFITPAIWPFVLIKTLKEMEKNKLIKPRMKTAWDHYFTNLREGSYVIVHMNDGTHIGGMFGEKSYASGFPNTGEIYIEELWDVNKDGKFTGTSLKGQGIIIKADQYKYIRVSS